MKFADFVGQFNFFSRSGEDFVGLVEKDLSQKKLNWPMTIATPNPEQLVQAWESPEFAITLKKFDYLLPDGMGLVCLSQTKPIRLLPIKQKIAGVDVVSDLLLLALKKNWRVLILGGRDYQEKNFGVNSKNFDSGPKQFWIDTLDQLTNLDSLKLGNRPGHLLWLAGFNDFSRPTLAEKQQIALMLQKLQPHLVFVAFGAPRQEFWIQENLVSLKASGARLAMAVGGSFDILTGRLPRAPKVFRQSGFEWLWRLLLQPTRIKRQLKLVKFVWLSLFN